MADRAARCATCRHYDPLRDGAQGACRRFPPTLYTERDPHSGALMPATTLIYVAGVDWCGEHDPAPVDPLAKLDAEAPDFAEVGEPAPAPAVPAQVAAAIVGLLADVAILEREVVLHSERAAKAEAREDALCEEIEALRRDVIAAADALRQCAVWFEDYAIANRPGASVADDNRATVADSRANYARAAAGDLPRVGAAPAEHGAGRAVLLAHGQGHED